MILTGTDLNSNNMKAAYFFILGTAILAGCHSNTMEGRIANAIRKSCKSDTCTIRIRNLTDFTWDKMYVFKYGATREEINKAIGAPLEHYTEFTRKIIFVSGRKIVFSEEEKTNIEGLVDNEVVFDLLDTVNYRVYTVDQAVFRAREKPFDKGKYYELEQAK